MSSEEVTKVNCEQECETSVCKTNSELMLDDLYLDHARNEIF